MVEWLTVKVLSSNPSTAKKKKKEEEEEKVLVVRFSAKSELQTLLRIFCPYSEMILPME
jgi:hypothetical protein